jgi:octaprenyl-diphosphate synthase
MAAVNQLVVDRLGAQVPLVGQLAAYLIGAGGKRVRPLLTLATAAACGYQGTQDQLLAAAVEFIHTATLLHDDVVDVSAKRRGKTSANEVFGNQASVLVGDFLFARAFELMVETNNLNVLKTLSHAAAIIAEGEVLQLSLLGDLTLTESQYINVVGAKTAALFAASCQAGAQIAGAPNAATQSFAAYGQNLGIAFQIADDVLDYSASTENLGKNVGDDFREGKVTLPVIYALQHADVAQQAFWQRVFAEPTTLTNADFEQAKLYLEQADACQKALQLAEHYAGKATSALMQVPPHMHTQTLIDLAHFVVRRQK